jgi:flagellar FliJ protein
MKKFQFKLRAVLNHRQRKEDGFKKELADLQRALEMETFTLNRLKLELVKYQHELKIKQQNSFDIKELPTYYTYFKHMQEVIVEQTIKVEAFLKSVEIKRDDLLGASKDKKAIEKLRDKKQSDHIKLVLDSEQKLIDENATMRHKAKPDSMLRG